MKLQYTRTFSVEVDEQLLIDTLSKLIDGWGYDDNTPENEKTMGVDDILQVLDEEGHLTAGSWPVSQPEVCEHVFEKDFYSVSQLKKELGL